MTGSMTKEHKKFLLEKVYNAKRKCLEMCVHAGEGHVTSAFSCAEIVTVLYYDVMDRREDLPEQDRDHFIMSKNHGSVITYPILADLGYFDAEKLMTFLQDGSPLGGHTKLCVPGVEFAGGALGIGLGTGAGFACGVRMRGGRGHVFVVVGDGESYEGSIWEAAMFAGHQRLDNLVAVVDRNGLAMTDFTANMVDQEPMADKWRAFGWEVREIDGHDVEQVAEALHWAAEYKGKPVCIIADTEKGHGIPFMCGTPFTHGAAPKGEKIPLAFEALEQSYAEMVKKEGLAE